MPAGGICSHIHSGVLNRSGHEKGALKWITEDPRVSLDSTVQIGEVNASDQGEKLFHKQ